MKDKDFFSKLLAEIYAPNPFDGAEPFFKTSADICNDFSGFIELDIVDVGKVMKEEGYRIAIMDRKPFWLLYGKDCPIDDAR